MGWYLRGAGPCELGVEFFDRTAARLHADNLECRWQEDTRRQSSGKANEGRDDRCARRPGIDVLGSAGDQCRIGRADKFPDMLRVFQKNTQCGPFAAKKTKFKIA
jgi:hypothetical protein